MNLLSFVESDYASIENFEQVVHVHAKRHDYAIVKRRFRTNSKIKILKKIVIDCNRNDFFKQNDITTKKTFTKKCDSFFRLNVIYYIIIEIWTFTVVRENHNHENIKISTQFQYRNEELTKNMFDKIDRFSRNNQCLIFSFICKRC